MTREEAERAYGSDLAGLPFVAAGRDDATLEAVRLPAEPTPGGSQGRGFLPLTYRYSVDGCTHALISRDGPEVDELRAFLHAAIAGIETDDQVVLWFESGRSPDPGYH